jgi:hypothetical protein
VENNTGTAYAEAPDPTASVLKPSGDDSTPLFLINLCASMTPIQLASKALPGLESYKLYQLTRVEDGRTRYRLRLGFFATEAEAEEVLVKVREQYPTAFTACLSDEDMRHVRGFSMPKPAAKPALSVVSTTSTPKPAAAQQAAPRTTATTATPPKAAPVTAPPKAPRPSAQTSAPSPAVGAAAKREASAAANTATTSTKTPVLDAMLGLDELRWEDPEPVSPTPSKRAASTPPRSDAAAARAGARPNASVAASTQRETKLDTAASAKLPTLDLTLSDPPPPPVEKPARAANEPFHVGKGVAIPATPLSLAPEPTGAAGTSSPAKAAPAAHAARPAAAAPKCTAPAATRNAPQYPDLDSTQTIRALTAEELNDENQEKWFAIQLAISEQPVNLETMPHLDIFEAYRLYSVATAGSGKIIHSLRLGFFKEMVSAEAVAGYLKSFFSAPTVIRVSVAEHERFKDATLPKKPAIKKSNVVELESARTTRAPTVPTVTAAVTDASITGSFKMTSTGSFRTSDTGKQRTLTPVKPAAKRAAPPTKRSSPLARKKSSLTGTHKALQKKSLDEQLLEEAKQVELTESGIFRIQKSEGSLLARLVDKLKK